MFSISSKLVHEAVSMAWSCLEEEMPELDSDGSIPSGAILRLVSHLNSRLVGVDDLASAIAIIVIESVAAPLVRLPGVQGSLPQLERRVALEVGLWMGLGLASRDGAVFRIGRAANTIPAAVEQGITLAELATLISPLLTYPDAGGGGLSTSTGGPSGPKPSPPDCGRIAFMSGSVDVLLLDVLEELESPGRNPWVIGILVDARAPRLRSVPGRNSLPTGLLRSSPQVSTASQFDARQNLTSWLSGELKKSCPLLMTYGDAGGGGLLTPSIRAAEPKPGRVDRDLVEYLHKSVEALRSSILQELNAPNYVFCIIGIPLDARSPRLRSLPLRDPWSAGRLRSACRVSTFSRFEPCQDSLLGRCTSPVCAVIGVATAWANEVLPSAAGALLKYAVEALFEHVSDDIPVSPSSGEGTALGVDLSHPWNHAQMSVQPVSAASGRYLIRRFLVYTTEGGEGGPVGINAPKRRRGWPQGNLPPYTSRKSA